LRICFFSILFLLIVVGCGSRDDRLPVLGEVKLKGAPLDDGIIEFSSPDIKTGTLISKGSYRIPSDQGLRPGKYKVSITSGDGKTPAESPDGLPGPTGANIVSKDRIPEEFNAKSRLEVTVSADSQNRFDFSIP